MHRSIKLVILTLLIGFIFISCKQEDTSNFTLTGSVKGLKKGVVYLQKEIDSSIVDLDSVVVNGQPEFVLKTTLDEPKVLYLNLDKKDGKEYFIPFFADKGVTKISSSLNNFNADAKIEGSKQQKILENYLKLMSSFKNNNLDLIKANLTAIKNKDSVASDSIIKKSERLQRLKYASTINFALNNSNSEVAPYLALYEIPNTSIKYLDTIYGNLNDSIKKSFYGVKLANAIKTYKKNLDSISK